MDNKNNAKKSSIKMRLNRELEHLEKSFKAGIVTKEEFLKGKERIKKKLDDIISAEKKRQESKKIIKELLEPETAALNGAPNSNSENIAIKKEARQSKSKETSYNKLEKDLGQEKDAKSGIKADAKNKASESNAKKEQRNKKQGSIKKSRVKNSKVLAKDNDSKEQAAKAENGKEKGSKDKAAMAQRIAEIETKGLAKKEKERKEKRGKEKGKKENGKKKAGGNGQQERTIKKAKKTKVLWPAVFLVMLLVLLAFALQLKMPYSLADSNNNGSNIYEDVQGTVQTAPNKLILYCDFGCSYCKDIEAELASVKKDIPGVTIVIRHFLIEKQDLLFGVAMECSNKQGKFASYKNAFYSGLDKLELSSLRQDQEKMKSFLLKAAWQAGLDIYAFDDCLDNTTVANKVIRQHNEAIDLGIASVPVIYYNGRIKPGFMNATEIEHYFGLS